MKKIGCVSVIAICAVMLIVWLTVYVLSGVSEAIALDGPVLANIRKEWLLDGSPANPRIEKYVAHATEPNRFFVSTNIYTISGQTFESLFGIDDPRFEGKGVLVVSKDGELIWVGSRKSPKLIRVKR
ncbi:MAG: hypothetical protein WAO02_08965 [Verrucomicrobiia bacterium]